MITLVQIIKEAKLDFMKHNLASDKQKKNGTEVYQNGNVKYVIGKNQQSGKFYLLWKDVNDGWKKHMHNAWTSEYKKLGAFDTKEDLMIKLNKHIDKIGSLTEIIMSDVTPKQQKKELELPEFMRKNLATDRQKKNGTEVFVWNNYTFNITPARDHAGFFYLRGMSPNSDQFNKIGLFKSQKEANEHLKNLVAAKIKRMEKKKK